MGEMLSRLEAAITEGRSENLSSEEIARRCLDALKTPTREMWKAWTESMPQPGSFVSNAVWWENMIEVARR